MATPDHDQRLKVLLKEFFEQFFRCFFPTWAERFDFQDVTWLDKEMFLAPPQGEKRQLDLVARLRIRLDAPPPQPGCTELVALIHIEIESRDSVQPFRPRMFDYYTQLRRDSQLPVLPIGLFLRVGLDGIGWDVFEEYFWEHRLVRFEYAYVGLPALDAAAYVHGEHLLRVALTAVMNTPPERRAELHAEALKRIAKSGENDWRQFLLVECLEAYSKLDATQRQQLEALVATQRFEEARPLMMTTYERGMLAGQRAMIVILLESRFGALSPETVRRLEALDAEQLQRLGREIHRAQSLKDLHLED